LEWDKYSIGSKNILIISNGFVDIGRPYLYTQNSRAKDIVVMIDGKPNKYLFRLEDTPNPQVLKLPEPFVSVDIYFCSVYRGTKWDDLCLNRIWAGSAGSDEIDVQLLPRSSGDRN
jgi:hypothetical protein